VGDINREYYRPKSQEQLWKAERDPITIHAAWLVGEQLAHPDALEAIEGEVRAEAEAAVRVGLDADYPPPTEVTSHVYA
jgi:acetoin:2,6-dichlorophenolindophenol oxidoreductase subunit alpha